MHLVDETRTAIGVRATNRTVTGEDQHIVVFMAMSDKILTRLQLVDPKP